MNNLLKPSGRILICSFFLVSCFAANGQSFDGGSGVSLSVCNDSSVMIWGNNTSYCSGTTEIVNSSVPVPVAGVSSVKEVASGSQHMLILKGDGTVWGWGINFSGSVGDGTTYYKINPVQAVGLSGIEHIESGYYHSFALKNDGSTWAWGDNEFGQLGTTASTDPSCSCIAAATQISSLNNLLDIAGGWNHSMAIKNDGTVWSWGDNMYGQLGDGTTTGTSTPSLVPGLNNIIQISCGRWHSVALKSDGTVWSWGDNGYGETGAAIDSTSSCVCQFIPSQVSSLSGIIQISAGDDFTVALKNDGTVWAWGNNLYGQLGTGAPSLYSNIPLQVTGLTGIVSIGGSYGHTLALKNDGTMWAWGVNNQGQLGNGTVSTNGCGCEATPVQVSSLCPPLLEGLNELNRTASLEIFPNPVSDHLHIIAEKIKTITITNALGQNLETHIADDIDVSFLSPGIYFVMIGFENGQVAVRRFIKE
jgi:alpha-tubulin suppressor-like RCC1 family protein